MILYTTVIVVIYLLALLYIKIANKYNIVDKPNHRSSHSEPVIRGAGVIFYAALILFFIWSDFKFPFFMLGVTLIAIVSYIDDLITLSSKTRLIFQCIAIVLTTYELNLLFETPFWYLPFLILIGVGFLNIFNFMDGINGMTALYALVLFTSFYAVNRYEYIVDSQFLVFVIISILIFSVFNVRKKARFFCGDVGSITLAVIIFFLVTYYSFKLGSPLFILFAGVYLTDGILTILYRKFLLKESVVEAHRHHIYQKLTDTKRLSHLKVSSFYALFQLVINIIVIFFYRIELQLQLVLFLSICFTLVFCYLLIFRILTRK